MIYFLDTNSLADLAQISLGESTLPNNKVSVNPYRKFQAGTDGPAAASATVNKFALTNDSGFIFNSIQAERVISMQYFGYIEAAFSFTAFTAGNLTSNLLNLAITDQSGSVQLLPLEFGSARQNPDPGTPLAPTINTVYTYQSSRPVLFSYLQFTTSYTVATWTSSYKIQFTGVRFGGN